MALALAVGAAAGLHDGDARALARRPLPPLTDEERALAERLRAHVAALAKSERNRDLATPARYIAQAFERHGLAPRMQAFESGGRTVRNIEVEPAGEALVVVGAHYDTVPGSPGADDNASGVAVLIELAALLGPERLPIRFVAFANEEMPYFLGDEMGSFASARRSRERGEKLRAMLSLEMLGYYRDAPGSQRYPPPLGLFYPDRGDFHRLRRRPRRARPGPQVDCALSETRRSSHRKASPRPSLRSRRHLVGPLVVPAPRLSGAIMVTDTAFNRYPHYHLPSDTPEKLDYERMARVTLGLAASC